LSCAASHATVAVVCVEPVERRFGGADGAVVSPVGGHAEVVAVTDPRAPTLPAASKALTSRRYDVPQLSPLTASDVPVVTSATKASSLKAL
jgi:hypothetical protein